MTMGSGSLAAMAVFEAEYKDAMTLDEAKALVQAAIMSGINNDLGSGGSVDMMVRRPAARGPRAGARARNNVRSSVRGSTRRLWCSAEPQPGHPARTQVINADGYTPLRNVVRPNERKFRKAGGYNFPRGTAKVLEKTFTPLSSLVDITTTAKPSAMEVG